MAALSDSFRNSLNIYASIFGNVLHPSNASSEANGVSCEPELMEVILPQHLREDFRLCLVYVTRLVSSDGQSTNAWIDGWHTNEDVSS
jgi:hypothetical protein